ncbi:MAG: helicase, partial [Acidimicrobiia bacterium]
MSDRSDPEIVAEQAYLDAVYDRLDAMRESAERVAAVYGDVRQGGTHQARLERDIAVETTHRRLAALDIGDTPLCFGRIDRTDDSQFYVGRLA